MMRVVNANFFSKFFKASAIVLMLSGSYAQTVAAPASYAIINKGGGEGKAVVNHLSTDKESLLFQVKVDNSAGERFVVVVRDGNGTTLYRSTFTDKEFDKKFRVPKRDSDKITFHIFSKDGETAETFVINSNVRVVEEVVVKKM